MGDYREVWHKKTRDGWTDWKTLAPPAEDLIVTVYEDNCDNPYYYTTSAWYLDGYWIHDNDVLNDVVAWRFFPKPCEEGRLIEIVVKRGD